MTKIYIKKVVNSKAKLLYLSGATFHPKSMFDLSSRQESFATILQKKNIETFTFDYIGCGPDQKKELIGNAHPKNIEIALNLIKEYKIDYIAGISYGALVAADLIAKLPHWIKGIIFLDIFANVEPISSINSNYIDGEDKVIITKELINYYLDNYQVTAAPDIRQAFLNNLFPDNSSSMPMATYPNLMVDKNIQRFLKKCRLIKCDNKFIFSKNTSLEIRSLFANHSYYPSASHVMLLEQDRYLIADDIEKFIDRNNDLCNHK